MTEIHSRKAEMSARADSIRNEMSEAVKSLGGGGKADAAIYAASRVVGLPASLVARLRWKKIKRIPADVADAVREARDRAAAEEARNELAQLDARLARLEAFLVQDEEFYRPSVDALRAVARGEDRPMDRGDQ